MSRKDEIIESAFLLFLDKGIEGTSIKNIITKANISNGGFYHYFENKEELIVEVIETYIYFYFKIPFEQIKSPRSSSKERIKSYIAKSIGYNRKKKIFTNVTYSYKKIDYKKLCILYFNSLGKYDFLKKKHKENTRYINNIIRKLIDDGKKTGEIKKNIDSKQLASIITSIFIGNLVTWMISDDLKIFDLFSSHLDYTWDNLIKN